MANKRIRRTKSFSSYLSAVNQDVAALQTNNNITGVGSGTITGTNLASEVSLSTSTIQSSNYTEGLSGWKIDGTGVAEFSDVFVRGDINAASGTIGYWNISAPGVERTIGGKKLFGTFLESSDIGDSDANLAPGDAGVYVGLFRSYRRDSSPVVGRSRKNNVAKITSPNHGFELGDFVTVVVNEDSTFNSGSGYLEISSADYDSFEYSNEGPDVTFSEGFQSSGSVNLYDENIAGLYLQDYSKSLFDYGYFSNEGVAYTSAKTYNYIHNPSFEFNGAPNIEDGWTLSSGLSDSASYNLTDGIYSYGSSYGLEVIWGETVSSTDSLTGVIDYPSLSQAIKSNRKLLLDFDIFFNPRPNSTTTIDHAEVLAGSSDSITVTLANHGFSDGDYVFCKALNPNRKVSVLLNPAKSFAHSGSADSGTNTITLASPLAATDLEKIVAGVEVIATGVPAGTTVVSQSTTVNGGTGVSTTVVTISANTTEAITNGQFIFNFYDTSYELPFKNSTTGVLDGSLVVVKSVIDADTFTVSNTIDPMPVGWVHDPEADLEISGISGTTDIEKVVIPVFKIADISIKFSNNSSVPIMDVLSDYTVALWAENGLTYTDTFITLSPTEVEKLIDATAPGAIPPLGRVYTGALNTSSTRLSLDLAIDVSLLYAKYRVLDSEGLASNANIKIAFPGWIYQRSEAPNANSVKYSAVGAGYIIDNVSLSTDPTFFYGDSSALSTAWVSDTDAPGSASYTDPKKWLEIDLLNQTATISNFDYLSLKSPTFSGKMLSAAGVYSVADKTDYALYYGGQSTQEATHNTTLYATSGQSYIISSAAQLTPNTPKTMESYVISRTTADTSYAQLSSDVDYLSTSGEYQKTYSSGFAAYSTESSSEASIYGDVVWITNKNYWYYLDEQDLDRPYLVDPLMSAQLGDLKIDMKTSFYTAPALWGPGEQTYAKDEQLISNGYADLFYQRKPDYTSTNSTVNVTYTPENETVRDTLTVSGTLGAEFVSVPDTYSYVLYATNSNDYLLITAIINETSVPFNYKILYIDYAENRIYIDGYLPFNISGATASVISGTPTVDIEVNPAAFTSSDDSVTIDTSTPGVFDFTVAPGGSPISAGDGITIDTTTTPGTSIISANVVDITSNDASVTIDSTTTPGTYDLSVSAAGSMTGLTAPGTDPIAVNDNADGTWDVSMGGGYVYETIGGTYPVIYAQATAPPGTDYNVGDIWIDY